MHVLVIYDVSDNKKRRRIFRILNGCGTRVQESAFECIISEARISALERKLSALIDRTDSVRFYRLPVNARISVYGDTTNELLFREYYIDNIDKSKKLC